VFFFIMKCRESLQFMKKATRIFLSRCIRVTNAAEKALFPRQKLKTLSSHFSQSSPILLLTWALL
jgi:hypothetical protein